MPFAPHLRVTALGRITTSGVERFAYGVSMAAPPENAISSLLAMDDDLHDIANDVAAFHARPASLIMAGAVLETVKIAHIGADGKYTRDAVEIEVGPVPGGLTGSSGFAPGPPQIACAVSLLTNRRGPTGKGRFFVPWVGAGVSIATGLMTVSDAENLRGSAHDLITALGNAPGFDAAGHNLQVVVASRKGYNTPVTKVHVGRVLDTVRSRRRSIPEAYTADVATDQGPFA